MEPKLGRLWSVYQKAKADYLSVTNKGTIVKIDAARFLRDTAENTIIYLRDKKAESVMMSELESTYKMAKTTVVSLTGGRKRKFDFEGDRPFQGTPLGPSNLTSKARNPDRGSAHGGDGQARYVGGFGGHLGGQASTGYGRTHINCSGGPVRGHSGIPFGYSRPVDSYHPY